MAFLKKKNGCLTSVRSHVCLKAVVVLVLLPTHPTDVRTCRRIQNAAIKTNSDHQERRLSSILTFKHLPFILFFNCHFLPIRIRNVQRALFSTQP